jgi:GGDEF domain-containing protein
VSRLLGIDVAHERALHQTLFDPLTGLPKWALLIDRTDVALARSLRTNGDVAVFALDSPRPIHGEPLDVVTLAYNLRAKLRPDDTVARIGPSTFVVVCSEIAEGSDAVLIAQRLVAVLGVTCRLGVALGGAGDVPEDLLVRALEQAAS